MDWFLYDKDLRRERVNVLLKAPNILSRDFIKLPLLRHPF